GSPGALERGDEQRALLLEIDERIRRLHRRMREERHDVHRLHHAGGSVPGLVRVAIAARDLSARRERCSGAALERGRGVRSSRRARPRDAQRLTALTGGPEVIRQDRNAGCEVSVQWHTGPRPRDPDDLSDAGNTPRLRFVDARDFTIELRTSRDERRRALAPACRRSGQPSGMLVLPPAPWGP